MKLTTTTLLFIFLTATSLMASGYTEEKHPFGWGQGYPLEGNFQTSTKPMWGDSEYGYPSQQYVIQSETPQGEGFHTSPYELWNTGAQNGRELDQWGGTQHPTQYRETGNSNSFGQGDERQLFTGNFLKEVENLVGDASYLYGTTPYEQASHEGGYIQENYPQFYGEQPYYLAPLKVIPTYTIRMSEG